jgi:predicted dithiol-disulfide oxidoreductase (DUF899 family)
MTAGMHLPEVVSPEEWLAARKELLVNEKEATRARDRVNADQRCRDGASHAGQDAYDHQCVVTAYRKCVTSGE